MAQTTNLDVRRREIIEGLDRTRRSVLGQFLTPSPVARFMASLFTPMPNRDVKLLDPGAGIGSLTAAFLEHAHASRIDVTCYEIEQAFLPSLRETLSAYPHVSFDIHTRSFIEDAVRLVSRGAQPGYDFAILNPPYRKISVGSLERQLLRKLKLETSNLYAGFVACAVALCRPGGEVIAIIPRSFMNGPYFKPFRYWILERASLTHIHSFHSRDRAFADDDVLQENVIIRLVVSGPQGDVHVSLSSDQTLADLTERTCHFSDIVHSSDPEAFIHIPSTAGTAAPLPGVPLNDLGLDVCTGPIVDFRLKEHLRPSHDSAAVPLLYPSHFASGRLEWPKDGRKPNAILRNAATERWLMKSGFYVVTRRFTSKEERRRIVAHVVEQHRLPGDLIAFENHLNVFHRGKEGLPVNLAFGLATYLNSPEVDAYFRTFSGHTQVNATDLRRLRYPDEERLLALGRATIRGAKSATDSVRQTRAAE